MPDDRQTTPWEEAIGQMGTQLLGSPSQTSETLPPFIPLGYNGRAYLYWIRRSETLVELTPERHNRNNILHLAPRHYWKDLLGEKWTYEDAVEHCYHIQGNTKFTPDRIRGIGFWGENGATIYNAGSKCYTTHNNLITETDNIRPNRIIYRITSLACEPAGDMLTDEEGRHIINLMEAHAWREQHGGIILSGLIVQGLLSGYMDIRAHGWINAPAGAGKTELKNLIVELLGELPIQFEGAESTEAAIRQTIGDGARLVLFDEAEHTADTGRRNLMGEAISYLRSCSKGGEIAKGGKDGAPKRYLAKSAFLLFSINNTLRREADMSRFCVLHLEKLKGNALTELLRRQAALKQQHLGGITTCKLVARLLLLSGIIKANADTIRKHFLTLNIKGRRAELLGTILAGAHALHSMHPVTGKDLEAYAHIAVGIEQAHETDDDSTRCINHLLETTNHRENKTLLQIIISATELQQGDRKYYSGILVQYGIIPVEKSGLRYLFIVSEHPALYRAFSETDWSNGWRETLLNLDGALSAQHRLMTGANPKRGVLVPWKHIVGSE